MFPLPSSPAFFTAIPSRRFRSAGFTLIELLATVAIIGTLAALLFPTMKASMLKAQSAKCQSILRQFGTAAIQYTTDNNGMALPAIVYTTPTTGNNWPALLRTYLGASDMYDKSRDAQYTCPAMAKSSSNAWAWGYGINGRPGYNGTTTVYPDNRLAYQNSPTQWFAPFQSLQVSNQSRRALLVDGDNWQIDPSLAVQSSGAALSRHGTNRCNVVFFDGHVETVAPDRLYKTLFDPASS